MTQRLGPKPLVTLLSLLDDCMLIARTRGEPKNRAVKALFKHAESARFGVLAPASEDEFRLGLDELFVHWNELDRYPGHKPSYPGILERDRRLAFCLGGLIQSNAFLPCPSANQAISMDALVLRYWVLGEDFGALKREICKTLLVDACGVEELTAFFLSLFQRSLARSHTMIPDMVAIQPWIDKTLELEARPLQMSRQYAEAVLKTPPIESKREVLDLEEPLLKYLARLRENLTGYAEMWDRALSSIENCSIYGGALLSILAALEREFARWH